VAHSSSENKTHQVTFERRANSRDKGAKRAGRMKTAKTVKAAKTATTTITHQICQAFPRSIVIFSEEDTTATKFSQDRTVQIS
jgi:hypothetical protein